MAITLNGTTGITLPNGSASAPAATGSDTDTGIVYGTNTVQVATGGTTAVTVDSSQNVGIGTSSPNAKLTSTATNGNTAISIVDTTNTTLGTETNYLSFYGTTAGGSLITTPLTQIGAISENGTYQQGSLVFKTTPYNSSSTERMRIDSSGNLLVGTTSGTTRMVVSAGNGDQLTLDNTGQTYTQLFFNNNGSKKADFYFENTTTRLYARCNTSGGVYLSSGGTSWTSASDERVKDIIEPIDNANEKIANWRTVVGKYKTDEEGTRRSFLIAQDVLATFPEAVDATKEDEYGVRYQDIIPVLVKAIQEQQAIIETQASAITALEARLTALEQA